MAQTNNELPFGCLVSLAIFVLIIWFLLPDSWTDPILYSTEYSVSSSQVHGTPKPTDCDWSRAPLGDKECHFKKTVSAYNAAGYLVGGDDTPRYGNDTNNGKPIISYDNGKNWTWLPEDAPKTPDLKITRVEIGWVKISKEE